MKHKLHEPYECEVMSHFIVVQLIHLTKVYVFLLVPIWINTQGPW